VIDKSTLLPLVSNLLESANARGTNQGVVIYEGVLKKIEEAQLQSEIDYFSGKLIQALNGIEAHGYFTSEEFEVVKEIRRVIEKEKNS